MSSPTWCSTPRLASPFKLFVVQAVHCVHHKVGGVVGAFFFIVFFAAGFLRRDDVQRHVLSDGVLDVVLEFLIEHFALLNGQFAFFHQLVQNPFGLFLCHGDRADAGQNQFAESFTQVIHDDCSFRPPSGKTYALYSRKKGGFPFFKKCGQ